MTRGNGETAIVLAVQRSESVRTTIPKHVAKKLAEPGIHVCGISTRGRGVDRDHTQGDR